MTLFALENPDQAAILIGFFLIIVFPVHEFSHAFAAWRLGDSTARDAGKLTLNPLRHFHPIGGSMLVTSVILTGMPLGFALTPVSPRRLRGRYGEAIVAAAGPASNVAMALGVGMVARILAGNDGFVANSPDRLWFLFYMAIYGNIILGIFNLMPVPPLDGGTVLLSVMNRRTRSAVEPMLRQVGILLFFVLFMYAGNLIDPVASGIFHGLVGY
jgi:Zn-dependent protease